MAIKNGFQGKGRVIRKSQEMRTGVTSKRAAMLHLYLGMDPELQMQLPKGGGPKVTGVQENKFRADRVGIGSLSG